MDFLVDTHLADAERAARDIADPAAREAVTQLIAAVRASGSTADLRSADLE